MKKFKKLSALLLAAIMTFAVTAPVFADDNAHVELTGVPAKTDKATVKVLDVEEGLTVTAYRIVTATYDSTDKNFRGYVAKEPLVIEADTNGDGTKDNETDGNDIVDLQDPKSEEITKIATYINAKKKTDDNDFTFTDDVDKFALEWDAASKTYKADLAPGYYIIKVSGLTKDNEKIYNPMLAGVYYGVDENGAIKTVDTMVEYETTKDADGNKTGYVLYTQAQVDADTSGTTYVQVDGDETETYTVGEGDDAKTVTATKYRKVIELDGDQIDADNKWNLSGTDLYAKSSPVEVEKTVYDNVDGDVATNKDSNDDAKTDSKHGDHHDIGDTVTFHAKADIPDYSDEYEKLVYKITDTLEADKLAFRDAAGAEAAKLKFVIGDKTIGDVEYTDGINYGTDRTNSGWFKLSDNSAADESKDEAYKITFTANTFVLELSEAAIRAHGGEKIYLEYYAEILEGAGTNFDENTNEIEVEFVNDPTPNDDGTPKTVKKKDITFHYTFELDGSLDGEESESGKSKHGEQSGHELAKVDEKFGEAADRKITYTKQDGTQGTATLNLTEGDANYGKYIDDADGSIAIDWDKPEFTEESWTGDVIKNGLAGAEFSLTPYLIKDDGTVPAEDSNKNTRALDKNAANLVTTTNDGGRLNFKGLDAGYYVMEETKAPTGYGLNPNKTVVFIDAEFYEENETYDNVTSDQVKAMIAAADQTADEDDDLYLGVDYIIDNDGNYKLIKFHKGELKSYVVKRAQLTPEQFDAVKGDLSQTTWGETSEYTETRTIDNGVVDYGVTTKVEGAASTFIQNTKTPVLPSTGGIGTYLFTILGVAIIAVAAFMLIFRKRRSAK